MGPLLDNNILILILIVLKPNNIFMLDIAPPLSGSFLKLVPTFQSHPTPLFLPLFSIKLSTAYFITPRSGFTTTYNTVGLKIIKIYLFLCWDYWRYTFRFQIEVGSIIKSYTFRRHLYEFIVTVTHFYDKSTNCMKKTVSLTSYMYMSDDFLYSVLM